MVIDFAVNVDGPLSILHGTSRGQCLGGTVVGGRTFDQAVVVSTPSRGVIKAPRSTQSSIPPG